MKTNVEGLQIIDCQKYSIVASCSFAFHKDSIVLLLLLSGTLDVSDAKSIVKLTGKDIILLMPPVSINALIEPVVISAVCFTTAFAVSSKMTETGRGYLDHLFGNPTKQMQVTSKQLARFSERIHSLRKVATKKKPIQFQREIVLLLFNLVLYEYLSLMGPQGVFAGKPDRKEKLFLDFLELVQLHCRKEHSVKFYAESLFVTAGYLGKVVRNVTKYSAKHFIEMAIISEAYTFLADPSNSIADIADELFFTSISSFSNFFKRYAKMSPRIYRETL